MDGIHDMGGMHGFGPVIEPGNDVVFQEPWESRVFAMHMVTSQKKLGAGPAGRVVREEMAPARYLAASYYERWLYSAEQRLIRGGVISAEDLDAMLARLKAGASSPSTRDPEMAARAVSDLKVEQSLAQAPESTRFSRGDRVRVIRMHPVGHTRCPRYVRGAEGTVESVRGLDALPDRAAYGEEAEPEPVYAVVFSSEELWGASEDRPWLVGVDLWESYLEEI